MSTTQLVSVLRFHSGPLSYVRIESEARKLVWGEILIQLSSTFFLVVNQSRDLAQLTTLLMM